MIEDLIKYTKEGKIVWKGDIKTPMISSIYTYKNIKVKSIFWSREYVEIYIRKNIFYEYEFFDVSKTLAMELWDEIRIIEKQRECIEYDKRQNRCKTVIGRILSKIKRK